jgi:hypothetical protein
MSKATDLTAFALVVLAVAGLLLALAAAYPN